MDNFCTIAPLKGWHKGNVVENWSAQVGSSRRKRLLIVGGLAAVLAMGWFFFGGADGKKDGVTKEPVVVTRGTLQETVTAQGKLEPKDYVDVGVQVSGQLKKLHVEIGVAVRQGELLADLDPTPYQSKVAADEAKVKSLKAQLLQKKAEDELSRSQLKRAEALIGIQAISQEELETKQSAVKVAAATVQSLEAQLAEAEANLQSDKINLGYTKIYAPINGVVSDQIAREGQTLNANQTTPTIVQVANLDVMTVRAQVAEADVMRLRPEMNVSFAPLGALDKRWKGKVRQILPTPQTVNDVVLYDALIDVDNADHQLMNGMSVQVFFETARAENVLILPVSALGQRVADKDGEMGRAYMVEVENDGAKEDRLIYVGLTTRTQAEIREGLREGDTVLAVSQKDESNRTPGKSTTMPRMPGGARL